MKKIVITIIVIISLLLFFQLAYYNLTKDSNNASNTNISGRQNIEDYSDIVNNNSDYNVFINLNSTNEDLKQQENVVVPSGITSLASEYTGELKLITIEKELYNFVYNNARKINEQTNWKSINYILQYYDLHTNDINEMGIYSAEEYRKIASQINKLDKYDTYERSSIEANSIENTQDGYIKFNVSLIYTSGKELVLNMYLANNEETMPNVKYTSGV